jgi:hypothetical protein
VLAGASWIGVGLAADDPVPDTFLRPYVRASDAELRRLARGEPLTHTVQSPDSREITTVGAIRVACTIDRFASRVRDVERFKAGDYLLEIGRFGAAPAIGDVAALTLTAADRRDLRDCRPGSCALRLPADAMARFRTSIPWGRPEEERVATAEMRAFVVAEAVRYTAGGLPALGDYADQGTTMSRAAAFRALLRPSSFAGEYQPDVFDLLDRFPEARGADAEHILYWSRERFGLKPITAVTHSMLVRRSDVAVFASKQVFSSHYFDASLGLSIFVPAAAGNYGYIVYMNRTRIEGLRGPLAGLVRAIATRRGRDGLEKTLLNVRTKLEIND